MSRANEQAFNYALGAALRAITPRWHTDPDRVLVKRTDVLSARALRPDLLIQDAWSPPLVIETSFQGPDADPDAEARLEKVVQRSGESIDTAFAVHIPEVFRPLSPSQMEAKLIAGAPLGYAVHRYSSEQGHSRWPTSGYLSGTVRHLATLLPAAAVHKEKVAEVAGAVATLLKQAADVLHQDLPSHLRDEFVRDVWQRSPLTGLRVIMVLWLDATLARSFLHQHHVSGAGLTREGYTSRIPLREHVRSWQEILARNWRPIFAPAVATLQQAMDAHVQATTRALDYVEQAREIIEQESLGRYINVGAEMFPILSEDRKEAAAFYTQPATAELLAGLTLPYDLLSPEAWGDAQLFEHRTLADLTCGTGTLLRAGYRRIVSFHEFAGGTPNSCSIMHRTAMEQGLVGTDISPIAAHLTSSSLAALSTGEPYAHSNIGWLSVGGKEGRAGALEYFSQDSDTGLADLFGQAGGISAGVAAPGSPVVVVEDASIDWILMNPPYSRTRGGQSAFDVAGLTEQDRKACQERWGRLTASEPCDKRAGMAASFLVLASKKVKPGGRIGFVLPLTAALAESWAVTRQRMEQWFDDLTAVAVVGGQALGQHALSADTHMEEMLLVGTRREANLTDSPSCSIRCVTLYGAPTRMGEAGEIARAIADTGRRCSTGSEPIHVGGDEIGLLSVFETDGQGSPWSAVGVRRPDLVRAALNLVQGLLRFNECSAPLAVPITTVEKLFSVGPTHDLIGHPFNATSKRGAFAMHPVRGPVDAIGADRALWAADSQRQRRLEVQPTHKGTTPDAVGSDAERQAMRQQHSTVFYARNMRWTSQALVAASTAQPVMGGSSWTALLHDDGRVRQAFALWANSTLGMLVHWTQGQRTQLGRSRTQVAAVRNMPCPKLDALGEEHLNQAAKNFERLKDQVLMPACQAHADEVRKTLDRAVLQMLRMDTPEAHAAVDTLRLLWCCEPSVHGGNRKAVNLLKAHNLIA